MVLSPSIITTVSKRCRDRGKGALFSKIRVGVEGRANEWEFEANFQCFGKRFCFAFSVELLNLLLIFIFLFMISLPEHSLLKTHSIVIYKIQWTVAEAKLVSAAWIITPSFSCQRKKMNQILPELAPKYWKRLRQYRKNSPLRKSLM